MVIIIDTCRQPIILHSITSYHSISRPGPESVFAVSCALTVDGDGSARADGVTLLPVGTKWIALAMECVSAGAGSTRLKLSADEALSEAEVRERSEGGQLPRTVLVARTPKFSSLPLWCFVSGYPLVETVANLTLSAFLFLFHIAPLTGCLSLYPSCPRQQFFTVSC